MTERGQRRLRAAGWVLGRRVSLPPSVAFFLPDGDQPWRAFLEEFSGLSIRAADGRAVWFDAARAMTDDDLACREDYARRAGCELFPVGGYSHLVIYLGADGRLYGGHDDDFAILGSTAAEAVDGLLAPDPPIPLTGPPPSREEGPT